MNMRVVTISARNRITIPREAREALGLKPDNRLLVVVQGKHLLILKKPESYAAAIRNLGRGLYPKKYLRKERDSWDQGSPSLYAGLVLVFPIHLRAEIISQKESSI